MRIARFVALASSFAVHGARRVAGMVAAGLLASAATGAAAHKASDAYLRLDVNGERIEQRLDIALRDLDRELALDADGDARLTWGEVRTRWSEIEALATRHVRIAADGRACTAQAAEGEAARPALDEHSDGAHAVLRTQWRCPAAVGTLEVAYDLFADTDPQHRGIVSVTRAGPMDGAALADSAPGADVASPVGADERTAQTAVLGPEQPQARFGPPAADSAGLRADAWPRFAAFVAEGVHHILIGADHILFLLTLLLPAVLVRGATPMRMADRSAATAAPHLRPVLAEVLKVVTAFTLAHSITLALAVLGVLAPPSRWVESIIAASVVLAALNNLWPLVPHRWGLTFVFGLVHGFGFAGAMQGLELGGGSLVAPLLGFNLGVELGQVLIVMAFLPLAWLLRDGAFYRRAVLGGGSLAAALIAMVWLVERAFDISLLAGA